MAQTGKTRTGTRHGGATASAKPRAGGAGKTVPAPARRKKSKLTAAREEASRLAGRTMLLATCEALKWNLTRVAESLEMATQADVSRALKELAPEEYEAAQADGRIARRRPEQS